MKSSFYLQKNPAAVNKLLNQANISITPLPRQPSNSPSANSTTISPRQSGDSKTKHLTCEICEGYVKVSINLFDSMMGKIKFFYVFFSFRIWNC